MTDDRRFSGHKVWKPLFLLEKQGREVTEPMIQEESTQRTVALMIRTTRLTESVLRKTMIMYTRGLHPSYGTNYQKTGKALMSQDEISVMDGGKCILQLRGVRPFLSDKYDITKHKQYHKLSDYDRHNTFNIEKYVKNRTHAKIKPNDAVDEIFDAGNISE